MNISLFIARRLQLLNNPNSKSSSLSTVIAVTGVSLAIIVMIMAISVVLGFKQQIKNKIMGFDAQIIVNPPIYHDNDKDLAYISLHDSLNEVLHKVVPNAEISLSLKQPGIIKTDDNFIGLVFKGLDNNHDWSFIKKNMVAGEIPNYASDENKNKIVISQATATSLDLTLNSKVTAYFFSDGNIKARRFEISGIYDTNFSEYDRMYAFAALHTLQRIAAVDSISGTSIEIRGIAPDDIETVATELQNSLTKATYSGQLDNMYMIDDIRHIGALYFNWLDLLDTNVIVILILMSCVAGITLVSSLFIIILERIKMIGILKALGSTNYQIRKIFIYTAQRLVIRGIIIGNAIAITFALIQERFHLLPLNPESYYLSYVPIEINWWHLLFLDVCVIILSILILILPSHLASTISPAQTMKYE